MGNQSPINLVTEEIKNLFEVEDVKKFNNALQKVIKGNFNIHNDIFFKNYPQIRKLLQIIQNNLKFNQQSYQKLQKLDQLLNNEATMNQNNKQINQFKQLIAQLRSKQIKLQHQKQILNQRLTEQYTKFDAMQMAIQNFKREASELRNLLRRSKCENIQKHVKIRDLQQNIQLLTQECQIKKAKIDSLGQQMDDMKEQHKNSLNQLKGQTVCLRQQINHMTEKHKGTVSLVETQNGYFRKENKKLTDKLNLLTHDCQQKKREIACLRQQINIMKTQHQLTVNSEQLNKNCFQQINLMKAQHIHTVSLIESKKSTLRQQINDMILPIKCKESQPKSSREYIQKGYKIFNQPLKKIS